MKTILVTGGLGFIGSHTIVELCKYDCNIIIIDNLCNSKIETLENIYKLCVNNVAFYKGDILDEQFLNDIFTNNNIDSVIHFAGLKSVGESVKNPILYYENNVSGTINLLKVMEKYNVTKLIFSSSATIYGNNISPFTEESPTGINITNPYGRTKYLIEEILKDLKGWSIFSLRYFNPVGCHPSGLIGETPNGIPNNLMPYIMNVASGKYNCLNVYGNDYNTMDGTGVRDYIHVVDLAKAHVKALHNLKPGFVPLNLGTGKGTSVLEMINCFQNVNNVNIPYVICNKREGDIDVCICVPSKASVYLNWQTELSVDTMCKDSWNFIKNSKKN